MPAEFSSTQLARASAEVTRPIMLVELEHSGTAELFSTGGTVIFDGRTFQGGGIEVVSMEGNRSATLELPATPARLLEVQRGLYRKGICNIWYLPAPPAGAESYAAEEGHLVLPGEIRASRYSDSGGFVQLDAVHRETADTYSPRTTVDQVTPFATAAGSQIAWEGDIIVLEAPR
jgi:hypothetical protein